MNLAIKYSHRDVYALLISRGGVPVNEPASSQIAVMQAAIKARARIDEADTDGTTALINALRFGTYDRRQAEAV